jgi:hypothetical protein
VYRSTNAVNGEVYKSRDSVNMTELYDRSTDALNLQVYKSSDSETGLLGITKDDV